MNLERVELRPCKKVTTYDSNREINGHLVELYKDGEKTEVYLSVSVPGSFKGYHLHRRRTCNFFLLKGKVQVLLVEGTTLREFTLEENNPQTLTIPTGVYIGLKNIGLGDAWMLNHPVPPYDPRDVEEQEEKTQKEIETQLKQSGDQR